ncbi:hypothetical protein AcW1_002294 [Taiwanofungus camphoratus]|nr:hypothetical protein AcV5_010296 [Antrodia cinnamomea]KAI0944625.1 hypothetical protein AcW1_002294 [Antrodia cinnamomea]KAI0946275.1 hypothetical protein AcV7_010298 [Antrodia cinnamomea]
MLLNADDAAHPILDRAGDRSDISLITSAISSSGAVFLLAHPFRQPEYRYRWMRLWAHIRMSLMVVETDLMLRSKNKVVVLVVLRATFMWVPLCTIMYFLIALVSVRIIRLYIIPGE